MSGTLQEGGRSLLLEHVRRMHGWVVEVTGELIRAKSENPPGDTREVAERVVQFLGGLDDVEVELKAAEDPIANVVARVKGARGTGGGRRLVFNGHLDTFPIGEVGDWSVDPVGGVVQDGKLYGRGASDMKGGLACSLGAFVALADVRESWAGEVVLTFAGDEESMGSRGTAYLMDQVPYAGGDAMLSGDAGSPLVLRFGEKGFIWLDLEAHGRASHGAHVHLGRNAIERLIAAIGQLLKLAGTTDSMPDVVDDAIKNAAGGLGGSSGQEESRVLRSITVNVGTIAGGRSANLVPERARAELDIRLPVGISVEDAARRIHEALKGQSGISYSFRRTSEPNWTDPNHEIVQLALRNVREAFGGSPIVNMRIGASDSRHYRLRGVPSVVCGLTPFNMGGPDEYVLVEQLHGVLRVHALTAFDFLSGSGMQ